MTHDVDGLVRQFDAHRPRLLAIARRVLGHVADAEDALQVAWLRVSDAKAAQVANPLAWFTTVITRICLDQLRTQRARRDVALEDAIEQAADDDAERDLMDRDEIGLALARVWTTLSPRERVVFVMHDVFHLTFDELADILQLTPAATRQIASRARRRVQHGGAATVSASLAPHDSVVHAFLAASRDGDFTRLMSVLAPDVVLRADNVTVALAAANAARGAPALSPETIGADSVARTFRGRASAALPATIDGFPGAVWMGGGTIRSAFRFAVSYGVVTHIEITMAPERLAAMQVSGILSRAPNAHDA